MKSFNNRKARSSEKRPKECCKVKLQVFELREVTKIENHIYNKDFQLHL